MADISIDIPKTLKDYDAAKQLFLEYIDYLDGAVCGAKAQQNLGPEFYNFPTYYDFLVLAKKDGEPVAACGVKQMPDGLCEIKRLFARPDGRGFNLGERITLFAIERSCSADIRKCICIPIRPWHMLSKYMNA